MVNLNSVNSLKKGVLNLCFQICVVVFFFQEKIQIKKAFSVQTISKDMFFKYLCQDIQSWPTQKESGELQFILKIVVFNINTETVRYMYSLQ